jgi:hypothetical protein
MFSAVYHFSYSRSTDDLSPSFTSIPIIRNDNEEDSFAGLHMDNRSPSPWYSDLLSTTDVGTYSDGLIPKVGHQLAMAESERCGGGLALDHSQKVSYCEDATAVSPISSCFPTDLSNYII